MQSQSLIKQFQFVRMGTLKKFDAITEEMADVKLDGLNNTLRWQLGHIYTVTELGMHLGSPEKMQLSARYKELFGNGTSPANWTGEIPTLQEIKEQLESQMARVVEVANETNEAAAPFEIANFKTVGEMVHFSISHEMLHQGQIITMTKLTK
ncbi:MULTISPECIES: DinB family protein [Bacillaceae]|uniref:DinB-like domain-containing protein n=1 Tax=Gottfriedia luciferensis TaxID=178774 RepID=A0ABX2ZZY3_9BACI|nr:MULTISPECIES: DinB family protein [Bacillaceae]ODG92628.1 hypothetical protein BED47_18225 [Gottfriedia luciferensis]SFC37432.1 DinB superfamily protein [Bacillus sp. UNCCL81]